MGTEPSAPIGYIAVAVAFVDGTGCLYKIPMSIPGNGRPTDSQMRDSVFADPSCMVVEFLGLDMDDDALADRSYVRIPEHAYLRVSWQYYTAEEIEDAQLARKAARHRAARMGR